MCTTIDIYYTQQSCRRNMTSKDPQHCLIITVESELDGTTRFMAVADRSKLYNLQSLMQQ